MNKLILNADFFGQQEDRSYGLVEQETYYSYTEMFTHLSSLNVVDFKIISEKTNKEEKEIAIEVWLDSVI